MEQKMIGIRATCLTALALGFVGGTMLKVPAQTQARTRVTSTTVRVVKHSLTHDGNAVFVGWSPDGTSALYRDGVSDQDGALWLASVRTGRSRLLVRGNVADATFTPEGRHILYRLSAPCCTSAILRTDLSGRSVARLVPAGFRLLNTQVVASGSVDLAHALLHDGRLLLYRQHRIFAVQPGGGRILPLSAVHLPRSAVTGDGAVEIAISPDGRWLATIGNRSAPTMSGVKMGRLAVGRIAGDVSQIAWSPDSRILLYQTGAASGSLNALQIGTHVKRVLQRFALETISGFTWSPNGQTIAFAAVPTGTSVGPASHILTVSIHGTDLRSLDTGQQPRPELFRDQPGETSPVWSPAGHAIGYTRLSRRDWSLAAPLASDAWIARLLPNR